MGRLGKDRLDVADLGRYLGPRNRCFAINRLRPLQGDVPSRGDP
jgi:hypothetical protein